MPYLLYFNQGYTDIINCLALITYYSKKFADAEIYLICRHEMKEAILFYTRPYTNIKVFFENKEEEKQFLPNYIRNYSLTPLIHGVHDYLRDDDYFKVFCSSRPNFIKGFYEWYDISPEVRWKEFEIERDCVKENSFYEKYICAAGGRADYICIHEENNLKIPYLRGRERRETKIINLNRISNCFFDTIKLLEGAKEIHVIDSVWMAFLYILQMRYGLFANTPIFAVCLRKYDFMVNEPLLPNWKIILC